METRIAKFEKVSREQFYKDMVESFGIQYGLPEDGFLDEIYERIKLPQRATMGSAGYDILHQYILYWSQVRQLKCRLVSDVVLIRDGFLVFYHAPAMVLSMVYA